MADILPFIVTLTAGNDVVPQGMPVDTLVVAPGTLNAGDDIQMTIGGRTMQLTAAGTYDLTAPRNLSGLQTIQGSTGDDALVVSQERLAGVTHIDLGGGLNVVQIAGAGGMDFSALTIENATIRGRASVDNIIGTQGSDRIVTAGGTSDFVDGNAGRDTVIPDVFFSQFNAAAPNPAELLVAGTRVFDANGERLYLRNVERVELRDGIVLLDQGANGAEAYRMVHAAFGTTPLEGTILSLRESLDNGVPREALMSALMQSLPFERAYGNVQSDAAFVDALYRVVLHRAADDGGRAVQLDALAHGMSRASMLVAFADTAEHVAVVGRAGTDGQLFVAEVGIA
ncbi:DUF4214 domain-containing protein [Roseiterribacter gracilis]|uniref:DUF4214 domain-containing protein n=1 Tax=Roseiterribacter gracilis TaxID=2812848 RepID=A0A8S8X825_9PROT|nr:hypothetical protein TMPK1_02590 [Rhodospirillales bacterium TMPK1]